MVVAMAHLGRCGVDGPARIVGCRYSNSQVVDEAVEVSGSALATTDCSSQASQGGAVDDPIDASETTKGGWSASVC